MTQRRPILACGLILLLLASAADAAGKKYSRLSLTSASEKGALIFHVPPQPANWTMIFTRVDEAGQTQGFGESLNMGGTSVIPGGSPALQIWLMKPGRYVVRFLKTQDYWAGCLSQSTVAIDIAAGKVVYIGTVDPEPTLSSISREVARTGKAISHGGIRMFHTDISPPAVAGAEPGQEAAITAEIRSAAPGLVAPIVLTRPVPTTFPRKPKNNPLAACG